MSRCPGARLARTETVRVCVDLCSLYALPGSRAGHRRLSITAKVVSPDMASWAGSRQGPQLQERFRLTCRLRHGIWLESVPLVPQLGLLHLAPLVVTRGTTLMCAFDRSDDSRAAPLGEGTSAPTNRGGRRSSEMYRAAVSGSSPMSVG